MNATLRNYTYLLSLTPGMLVVFGNLNGGVWALGNVLYSFVLLGFIDFVSGDFLSSKHSGKDDSIPNLILRLHVVLQLGSVLSFVYGVSAHTLTGNHIWYAAVSMSIYTGSGAIVVAHELIHRKALVSQFAGKLLLFTAGNFWFFIEHLKVHHKWVGTQKDSATAKRGQSIYGFFVTSSFGQIKGAWKLESERCRKEGYAVFSLRHYMLRQIVLHVLFDTLLFIIAGPIALAAWFVHCVVANFLLEYVNYIEHYGLQRNESERATEHHSWQSDRFVSRFVLIDLSRHADHHYYASKPYHILDTYEKSPVLPGGYASLIVPVLIPFWWRKLTHPILDSLAKK